MSVSYLFIVLPLLALIVAIAISVIGYRKWRAKSVFLGIITFVFLSALLVTTVIPGVTLMSINNPSTVTTRVTTAKVMNEVLFKANSILKQLPTSKQQNNQLLTAAVTQMRNRVVIMPGSTFFTVRHWLHQVSSTSLHNNYKQQVGSAAK